MLASARHPLPHCGAAQLPTPAQRMQSGAQCRDIAGRSLVQQSRRAPREPAAAAASAASAGAAPALSLWHAPHLHDCGGYVILFDIRQCVSLASANCYAGCHPQCGPVLRRRPRRLSGRPPWLHRHRRAGPCLNGMASTSHHACCHEPEPRLWPPCVRISATAPPDTCQPGAASLTGQLTVQGGRARFV